MAQTNEELQASDLNFQTPEGRKSFWLNIFSVWLGTTMEYVDFALYGLAAGLVFGDVFFPEQTPIIALLSSFATYAVGFLARPLGAIILGRVGDRHGRKVIMVITVGLMGISTTALGLLPTYRQVGWLAPRHCSYSCASAKDSARVPSSPVAQLCSRSSPLLSTEA